MIGIGIGIGTIRGVVVSTMSLEMRGFHCVITLEWFLIIVEEPSDKCRLGDRMDFQSHWYWYWVPQ